MPSIGSVRCMRRASVCRKTMPRRSNGFARLPIKVWAIAQNDMGIMYRQGWGVTQDSAEAVNWFRRAADQDFVAAQNNLGDMYAVGLGVPRDYDEAVKCFAWLQNRTLLTRKTFSESPMRTDSSCSKADADALAWYRRAANKVYDSSHLTLMHSPQYNLAAMYASGRGISKDNVQAYMWFTLAAKLGDIRSPDPLGVVSFGSSKETALEQRDKVAALMTRAEIAEGEKLAREWSPHPVVFITPQAR